MSGRKPSVSPAVIIDAGLQFKDRVVHIGINGEKSKYLTTFYYN